MDLRTRKTQKALRNAFLELRAKKDLERITIKELTDLAEVSKATFYLHYRDIYDLSDYLQREVVANILNGISNPSYCITDSTRFTRELIEAFYAHKSLVDILFSGGQASILPMRIEEGIKEYILEEYPHLKDNVMFHVLLTYQVQGSFYAQKQNIPRFGSAQVLQAVDRISAQFEEMMKEQNDT